MIVCPRCSKENQDHYKFCLGCGAELPRAAAAAQPKSFTAPTPPSGMPVQPAPAPVAAAPKPASGGWAAAPAAAPAPMQAPPMAAPAPAAEPATLSCPNCGSQVPRNFKFCGTCGHDMTKVAAPAAAPAQAPVPQAAPAPVEPARGGATRGRLVLIRPDGSEGDSVELAEDAIVGRDSSGPFASDSYLSPQHARFTWKGTTFAVADLGSLNGVYVRIDRDVPTELPDGTIFRIGQEILRFEQLRPAQRGAHGEELMGSPSAGMVGRILLIIGRDTAGNAYTIPTEGLMLGRERGDIIFPDDGYVSGLHCRLNGQGGKVFLTDLGSSNGTFIRLTAEATLRQGSLLLMGQQLFRLDF